MSNNNSNNFLKGLLGFVSYIIGSFFLIIILTILVMLFEWLTDQYMWFFDYTDRSKAYVIVGFIIVSLVAAIFLIGYIIDKNEQRDKLYKKHLETIEKDRREAAKHTYKAAPHKTEKTKLSKTSKPFKTSTVTHEEDPVYSQDTFNKKDLSSAGFKVVKKAKDD
tara:strand:- start:225 stop:716 length:492 start_codon:yes stop_codon:yes gene_type:complete